jgi:hypothetical protein
VNYKRKYQASFPTVKIIDAAPGRIVTPAELEQRDLPAPAFTPVFSRIGRTY